MIRFIFALLAYFSFVQIGQAAPVLKQGIFEFNSRVKVQEEFLILTSDTVSDPAYSLNELRIQLNASKTYAQIGFYDNVSTTYGTALAYNTTDVRWRQFKNKLLYIARTTASASKFEVIPFRVMNPAGEVSDWGQIRLSLGGQYDQKYDYYPRDDIASAFANQPVDINVLQNDPNVQSYYKVEIYGSAANGTVTVNADKTMQYTSAAGFTGQDKFSYRVAGNNLYDVYSAPATVTVYVQSPNNPPQISGAPDIQVYAGQAYSFTPQASDLDNDTLSFSILNKPGWATFDVASGSLSGIPTSSGTHTNIVISVSDGIDSVSLAPFGITVGSPPAPKVNTFAWVPAEVEVGEETSFYWDIENVTGCYGVTGANPTVLKPASGSVGPYEYTEASTFTTKFYCIDLAGNRYPTDENTFIEATRSVVSAATWAETSSEAPTEWAVSADNYTPINSNVGAVAANVGVSGGQASYSVPIQIAPGRAGMQPDVALNYQSRSGNGLLGVGFSLSAGSGISRCAPTVAQDGYASAVNYQLSNDKLCLDGERLVEVDGSYGYAGTVYRTEVDKFARVTQLSGDLNHHLTYFKVEYAHGRVAYFGSASTNAKVIHAGRTETFSWLLAYEHDLIANNYIHYVYSYHHNAEILLSNIYYTGNGITQQGSRRVAFEYESRPDINQQYLAGGLVMQTKRLKQVSSYLGNTPLHQYTLSYQPSGASGRSLLQSVEQCSYLSGSQQCLKPTVFEWQDDAVEYKLEKLTFDGEPVYQDYRTVDGLVPHGDINGDGVRDWPNKFVSAEGKVTGSHNFELKNCQKNPFTLRMECVEGDFDNNGLTDGWNVSAGKLQLLMTQASLQQTIVNTDISLQSKQPFARQQDHVRHIADFNGDGWQDMVIYRYNNAQPYLDLYPHSGSVTAPYQAANKTRLYTFETEVVASQRVEKTSVQFIGDIDGNGLPDLAEAKSYAFDRGSVSPTPLVRKFLLNHSTLTAMQFSEQTFLPFGDAITPRYFSYFIDINGDGLSDWLGWADDNFTLQLRLNEGSGQFSALIDLGVTIETRRYQTHINGEWSTTAYPKYLSSFRVMDTNQDGKAELLIPGDRVATACTTVKEATEDGLRDKEVCGDEMYLPVRMQPESLNTSPLPTDQFDDSVYRFKALQFAIAADGQVSATEQLTDIYASATENFTTDAFGKGLSDLVFTYGPRFEDTRIDSVSGALSGYGHQYGVYINKNKGSASSGQPYAPSDILKSVTNGLGKHDSWVYLPLSTSGGQLNNLPFYLADRSYVDDGQHFNFASSMYVVAEHNSSNGVGGLNTTRYAYRGAMYHTLGRGFRGFRAIISEDTSSGLITHTDFRQKFPFTGQVRGQFVFQASDYPTVYPAIGYSSNTATGADDALSAQVNHWQLNAVHQSANGVASCTNQYRAFTDETDLACPASGIYSVYQAGSDSYQRDLHSKQLYSHTQKQVTSVDAYSNVLQASQTLSDDSGIYASSSSATYSPQTGSVWAPHRLQSQTRHSTPVQQLGTVLSYPAALDTASWVKTTYSDWHSSGAPQKVVSQASDSSQVQTVVTSYNAYGLPLMVTRSANVMSLSGSWSAQSRSESIGYSNNNSTEAEDGYFPFKLTNALNHVSYIHSAAATGQPLKQIAANGVSSNFTYDAFGRPATAQQSGQAKQIITHDTVQYDNNAPDQASWMIVTTQAGSPQQRSYFDILGRPVRKSIKGFNGDWVNRDTEYNNRGLVVRQSAPRFDNSGAGDTVFADYDVLGRPGSKQVPGGLSVTYDYHGLTTDISANNQLQMSRSYNSLNKLLHTEDAKGGLTYYRYNGQGLPIVLQDANGVQLTASYNALGQKLQVKDPNQGNNSYQYNGFGELEQETDANNLAIRFDYDLLGRQITRTSYSGSTVKDSASFSYDTALKGLPYREIANGVTRTFGYDANANLTSNTVQLDGKSFTNQYFYHSSTGQPSGMRYPNGLTVQYGYTPEGYPQTVSNLASGYVYRTIDSQDAFGNTLMASLGNGVHHDNQYDSETGWVNSLTAWRGSTRVHDVEYQLYDVFGNIRQVQNHVTGAAESYDYDELHRLTNSTYSNMGFTVPISYSYDAVGNLQSKSDYANTYRYGNAAKSLGGNAGSNAVRQVVKLNNSTVNFSYDNQGNLTAGDGLSINYNSFKQPTQISRGGNTFGFTYGANLERLKETRNGITTYEIDKLYEEESNGNWRIYLQDIAIIKYDETDKHQIRYTHKDRLGSTLTYTDHDGQVTDRRMFDAFGKPRAVDGNSLLAARLQNLSLSRNGFTDHRHLDEVELIHMNGRAYDYNLGRFLSVDPLIQDAANSQSLNPYSYIINNPLSGTDPTGYARITGSRIDRDIKESDIVGDNITGVGGNVTFSGTFQGGGNGGSSNNGPTAPATESRTDLGQKDGSSNNSFGSGLVNGALDGAMESAWNEPLNPLAGINESAADFFGTDYVSPLDQPVTNSAQLGKDIAPWAVLAIGLVSRSPKGVANTAEGAADAVLAAGKKSGAAAELRVGGKVFTAVSGEMVPSNAQVTGILMGTPASARKAWHGGCAEIACLDKALNAGVNPSGGIIRAVNIGVSGTGHGTPKKICSSCNYVLAHFGVNK